MIIRLIVGLALFAWAGPEISSAQTGTQEPAAASRIDLDPRLSEAEANRIAAIKRALPATVCVFDPKGNGGGSGVCISPDGFALTNYHVVKPCGDTMKCSMPDGKLYDAVLVGIDPTGDVALIKLLGRDDFPVATLGDSDRVRAGQWCFAVGNPFLLATDFQPTVSWGVVSGVNRYQYPAGTLLEYADCIQTDAAINPGNSGGPLFNAASELIGINGRGSFEKRGRVNVGVGYAISINQIKYFIDHLKSGRIVDHATLGATVSTDDQGRVVVGNILESSDAYRRGLRVGDEIIRFGDRPIGTVNQFKNVLGIYPKGWRVPLEFRREGDVQRILTTLEPLHDAAQLIELVQGKPAKIPALPDPEKRPSENPLLPATPPAVEIPKDVARWIEKRSGYANFYFNRHYRQLIWERATEAIGTIDNAQGTWILDGTLTNGTALKVAIGQETSGMRLGETDLVLNQRDELADQLGPADSGGLLLAMHLWRRLLVEGPDKFGDVTYLGSLPDLSSGRRLQVLVAVLDTVQTNFLFDPESGRLVAMEVTPDVDVDPCILRFDDEKAFDAMRLPTRFRVTHGDEFQMEFRLKGIRFEPKE